MPTATARRPTRAVSFALGAVAWSLGLFGLLRLNWVEVHALLPLTRLQGRLAVGLCGTPALPIDATLACSGADALALCVGVILAYPARWRVRLAGAGVGIGFILVLNTLRIGTLGLVVASPRWFETLHVYLWPAVLTLAIAGYVFAWMRFADRRRGFRTRVHASGARDETPPATVPSPARLTPRFILFLAALLLLFTAASPLYLESAAVLAVAAFIARVAAGGLHLVGMEASATGNLLWTSRGGFLVTQECISTPLIPVYLAAVLAYSRTWRRGALGLLAAAPLFVGLGVARLLVVALPAALVASPVFLIHAFYQLLLAAVVVCLAAVWRHGAGRTAVGRALAGVALGVAVARLLGAPYAHLLTHAADLIGGGASSGVAGVARLDDPQGAVALLPPFQVGLYLALWVAAFAAAGWRRLLTGLALLGMTQLAALLALPVVASHLGLAPSVADVRAWAVVGPIVTIAAVVTLGGRFPTPTPVAKPVGAGAHGCG